MDTPIRKALSYFKELPADEKGNVITHFFGCLLSVIGTIWLSQHLFFESTLVLSMVFIYGFSMIFLFTASTIYHAAPAHRKAFWQRVDHIAIYFLIAGTYTPVGMTVLYETNGPRLLAIVWGLAAIGLLYKLFFINRWQGFSLFLYLGMGWLVIFEFSTILKLFSEKALLYLVLGGFFYTFGVLFYRWHSLRFHHVIWHIFVLLGAISHFAMITEILFQTGYLDF